MSTTIYNCSFNREGKDNLDKISAVEALNKGEHTIADLVGQIVAQDFSYSPPANSRYTLSLINIGSEKEMTLKAANGIHKKLTFDGRQWSIEDLTTGARPTPINTNPDVITGRLSETLYRIGQLHLGPSTEKGKEEAVGSSKVDASVQALGETVRGFQTLMDLNLSALERTRERLERLPGELKESIYEGLGRVQVLESLVRGLEETLKTFQKEKQDPSAALNHDIPVELRAINSSINELTALLRQLLTGSSEAKIFSILENIDLEIRDIKKQNVPLAQKAAELQQENEALKNKLAQQNAELSLKDRQIENLSAKNSRQADELASLEAELDIIASTAETFKRKNEELEESEESLQARIQVLESELASSGALSEKTQSLEAQLFAANAQQALVLQENERLREELKAARQVAALGQQQIGQHQTELDGIAREVVAIDGIVEQLITQERELAAVTEEKDRLQDELLGAQDAEKKKLRAQFDALQAQFAASNSSKENEISKLQVLLSASEKANQVSEKEIQRLGETLKKKQLEIEDADQAAANVKALAQKAHDTSGQLRIELELSKDRHREDLIKLRRTEELLGEKTKTAVRTQRALDSISREHEALQQEYAELLACEGSMAQTLATRALLQAQRNKELVGTIEVLERSFAEAGEIPTKQ